MMTTLRRTLRSVSNWTTNLVRIKEKLIPRAIDWFTGEALAFEELDDDLEEGDFEDEDDEEDDDLSEDRDEDDESEEDVSTHLSFAVPRC